MKRRKPVKDRCCPYPDCARYGQFRRGNIVRHSFYVTSQGKRRRYRCKTCGRTFCSTHGTPYYRLHGRRNAFDEVVTMSVNGIDKSAIARIKKLAWTTVARWLELAAYYAARFNRRMLKGIRIRELQADEIRSFVDGKCRVVWIFTALEVWSRLWISKVVGRRNYRNVKELLIMVLKRGEIPRLFLFTTDGFEIYEWAARRFLRNVCVYGQVIKKRRNNRVVQVNRKLLMGTKAALEECFFNSEDSDTLNTSFVERHNLTIRQGCSYLSRRSPCHARDSERLNEHMELLQCYYNFIRPHGALKFGKDIRTPARQAGLVSRALSFREVFTYRVAFFCLGLILFVGFYILTIRRSQWIRKRVMTQEIYTLTTVPDGSTQKLHHQRQHRNRWCQGRRHRLL